MAAIAASGEASLANVVDIPYRVDVADVVDFFDLRTSVWSSLERHAASVASAKAAASIAPALADGPVSLPVVKVGLQIPDEFLSYADRIMRELRSLADERVDPTWLLDVFILADTQYSPCCVDEVAAQHFDADAVVHFGRSCLSKPSHMPVVFAFGKVALDVEHAAEAILHSAEGSQPISVIYDVTLIHAIPQLKAVLASHGGSDRVRFCDVAQVDNGGYVRYVPTREVLAGHTIVLLGPPSSLVGHYSLVFSQNNLYHYNPLDMDCSRPRSILMKRYALMQKARDASIIGIVVGTLGVANYIDAIAGLKRMIRAHGKKYYTFVLGKLNVAKLANFMEIDVFVLVACPESSLIDSKEFYRPVVTPYELSMALDFGSSWTGEYKLEFGEVLSHMQEVERDGDEYVADAEGGVGAETDGPEGASTGAGAANVKGGDGESDDDPDQPYFSLVTGTYVSKTRVENNAEIHSRIRDLTLRDASTMQLAFQSPASQHVATRSWRGLEVTAREDKSLDLVEGRFGNAAGYEGEQDRME
ncbi:Diphthamide biosynthesis protein 2 [Blastocladiella emersonii ATCC 22665]|nr:Diphthamide biosynthesis protein 2 [Blastocladiella emersonii ATCC 22665]